jgi:uncharacterized protein YggE
MTTYHSTINITAVGQVNAAFDRCTFRLKTSVLKPTTVECKKAIRSKILEIDSVVKSFGFVCSGSHKTSSEVDPEKEYNSKTGKHESTGYRYTHTCTFRINDVSKVNEVMDALTSINDVQMDSPVFSIKNDTDLKTQAMELAFNLAKKNFDGQCKMAGIDHGNFTLESWDIRDGNQNQEFSKTSIAETFSPMWNVDELDTPETVKSGVANVTVSVTLKFVRTFW